MEKSPLLLKISIHSGRSYIETGLKDRSWHRFTPSASKQRAGELEKKKEDAGPRSIDPLS